MFTTPTTLFLLILLLLETNNNMQIGVGESNPFIIAIPLLYYYSCPSLITLLQRKKTQKEDDTAMHGESKSSNTATNTHSFPHCATEISALIVGRTAEGARQACWAALC